VVAQAEAVAKMMRPVGRVMNFAQRAESLTRKARRTMLENIELDVAVHCGRVATAAEWLFDAESESPSATTFVQVAIAFEALLGGERGEPITETIANRVAYLLGQTPSERNEYEQRFKTFYDLRSKIVHQGQSRLSATDSKVFFNGKELLKQALDYELKLAAHATEQYLKKIAAAMSL
jgi:hypothetical protein